MFTVVTQYFNAYLRFFDSRVNAALMLRYQRVSCTHLQNSTFCSTFTQISFLRVSTATKSRITNNSYSACTSNCLNAVHTTLEA